MTPLRFLELLLLLSIAGFGAHAQTNSGDDQHRGAVLYHDCQASIRIMDAPNADAVGSQDFVDSNFCIGYFTAFWEFNGLEGTSICRNEARLGTTIRVYLAYMEKNPKLMDDAMIVGVIGALKETYPCPASHK